MKVEIILKKLLKRNYNARIFTLYIMFLILITFLWLYYENINETCDLNIA